MPRNIHDFDSSLFLKGFLYPSSSNSFEKDFKAFAINLFNPSEEFRKAVSKNKKLKQKQKLLINFFNAIDDSLTKKYFSKLNKFK